MQLTHFPVVTHLRYIGIMTAPYSQMVQLMAIKIHKSDGWPENKDWDTKTMGGRPRWRLTIAGVAKQKGIYGGAMGDRQASGCGVKMGSRSVIRWPSAKGTLDPMGISGRAGRKM